MAKILFSDTCSDLSRWTKAINAYQMTGGPPPGVSSQWKVVNGAFECREKFYVAADMITSNPFFVPPRVTPQLSFNGQWSSGTSLYGYEGLDIVVIRGLYTSKLISTFTGTTSWKKWTLALPPTGASGENYKLKLIFRTSFNDINNSWCRVDNISVFIA